MSSSSVFESTPLYFAGTMKDMQIKPNVDAYNEFTKIEHNLGEIVKIACTDSSCYILTSTGDVYAPLAQHSSISEWQDRLNPSFVHIQDATDVVDLTCGSYSVFLFQKNHNIKVANFNSSVNLVVNTNKFTGDLNMIHFTGLKGRIAQIAATSSSALFLSSRRKQLYSVGFGQEFSQVFEDILEMDEHLHVIDISAGAVHALALLSDGRVAAFGDDSNGQLGGVQSGKFFEFDEPVKSIYAGSYHSFFVTPSGIHACGYSGDYRLGVADSRLSQPKRIEIFDEWKVDAIPHIIGRVSTMFVIEEKSVWNLYFIGDNERGEAGIGDQSVHPRRPILVNHPELFRLLNDRSRYVFNYSGGYYFRFFYFTRNRNYPFASFFRRLKSAQQNASFTDLTFDFKE